MDKKNTFICLEWSLDFTKFEPDKNLNLNLDLDLKKPEPEFRPEY
jgi:hypothetical protein